MLSIIPIAVKGDIIAGQNLSEKIISSIKLSELEIQNSDILVIAQKIVSKSEGRMINLESVIPSSRALKLATIHEKDPRLIQLILNESKKIVRLSKRHIISQTKHGFVCANAGIDQSNVSRDPRFVLLLPEEPDISAEKIRKEIFEFVSFFDLTNS